MAKLNRAQRRQKFNSVVVGVLRHLGTDKASTGFSGRDIEPYLQPVSYNSGGFISEAIRKGVIETIPKCANQWRFSRKTLEERGIASQPQNVSDELKQLYLAFGDGGTLLIGRSEIATYFAVKRTSRSVHAQFNHANGMIQWLDARKDDFLSDGATWMYLKPIPEDWQHPATEGETSQKGSDEGAAKIITAHCGPEERNMMDSDGLLLSPVKASAALLNLPQPEIGENPQRAGLMRRLIEIYKRIGTHEPVSELRWRRIIAETSPTTMNEKAVDSWLSRQSDAKKLIDYLDDGSCCYVWNVANLRAYFGMPPEEVSSAAEAPVSALSPEEVPDAVVEVMLPLTESEKAAEFAAFMATARPSYLDQLHAQHDEAVAASEAAAARVQAARLAVIEAVNAARDANDKLQQCANALREEVRSIARTEVQKIFQQLSGLSQDVREQTMQMLIDPQQ
ncbi:MAG: hypothetical protein WC052_05860 [Patescibacteria group bacterium]